MSILPQQCLVSTHLYEAGPSVHPIRSSLLIKNRARRLRLARSGGLFIRRKELTLGHPRRSIATKKSSVHLLVSCLGTKITATLLAVEAVELPRMAGVIKNVQTWTRGDELRRTNAFSPLLKPIDAASSFTPTVRQGAITFITCPWRFKRLTRATLRIFGRPAQHPRESVEAAERVRGSLLEYVCTASFDSTFLCSSGPTSLYGPFQAIMTLGCAAHCRTSLDVTMS